MDVSEGLPQSSSPPRKGKPKGSPMQILTAHRNPPTLGSLSLECATAAAYTQNGGWTLIRAGMEGIRGIIITITLPARTMPLVRNHLEQAPPTIRRKRNLRLCPWRLFSSASLFQKEPKGVAKADHRS